MPLLANIRQLENKDQIQFSGEMTVEDLDILGTDECIFPESPLRYRFQVMLVEDGILLEGNLSITVGFECVKCLKRFEKHLELANWKAFAGLRGEDAARVVSDCVDLTPILREDILLAFPQHPLCELGCAGLPQKPTTGSGQAIGPAGMEAASSVWAELDKLKL
jgi:uncharacterized protein